MKKYFRGVTLPPDAQSRKPYKAEDFNRLLEFVKKLADALEEGKLKPSADIGFKTGANGTTAWVKRHQSGGGASTPAAPCPFGEIYTYTDESGSDSSGEVKTGIRGGIVRAGDKTWNFIHQPYEINLAIDGEWQVHLRTVIIANMNPSQVATLSGVETSTLPTWVLTELSESFEDAVIPVIFPTVNKGAGVSIVVIGNLKVEGGVATLSGSGCGDIGITHCPGTLSHVRGFAASELSDTNNVDEQIENLTQQVGRKAETVIMGNLGEYLALSPAEQMDGRLYIVPQV